MITFTVDFSIKSSETSKEERKIKLVFRVTLPLVP